jgi:hypothetical protein
MPFCDYGFVKGNRFLLSEGTPSQQSQRRHKLSLLLQAHPPRRPRPPRPLAPTTPARSNSLPAAPL